MSRMSRYVKHMKKELAKETFARKHPDQGTIVIVQTKYGTERQCVYTHKKFTYVPYSFSHHEIESWKYLDPVTAS